MVSSPAPTAPTSEAEPDVTITTEGVVDDAPGAIDVLGLMDAGMIDLTIDVPELIRASTCLYVPLCADRLDRVGLFAPTIGSR